MDSTTEKWEPVSLPYYRPATELPAPLPTVDEIKAAPQAFHTVRDPEYSGLIVLVRDTFVVKHGNLVSENEGNVLLFIEKHLPSLPVQKLYAMFREGRQLYLIMQYVPGRDLQQLWADLSEAGKVSICTQLREMCDRMRALPSPGFFGSVDGGQMPHRFFYSFARNPAVTGPFGHERELSLGLAEHSRENWVCNGRRGWVAEFFERNLPKALCGDRATFTHSDLHPQNVIVSETGGEGGEEDEEEKVYSVAAIIDWEKAGWYPDYWEYAASFVDLQWDDDWPEKYETVVEPWPLQAALLRMVRQDLDF